jgi:hypothetical protein
MEAMRVLSYKKLDIKRRYERLFEKYDRGDSKVAIIALLVLAGP